MLRRWAEGDLAEAHGGLEVAAPLDEPREEVPLGRAHVHVQVEGAVILLDDVELPRGIAKGNLSFAATFGGVARLLPREEVAGIQKRLGEGFPRMVGEGECEGGGSPRSAESMCFGA